ncbi:uncharacterized protein LOC125000990 isoform X6 [Mugil cephalus]|uniref:uncharacterized protein LOC125000990 isoform X6 n=1 Tax=Mugil cephalus TaxID=48193 RepID=UPI001FB65E13|nr:uncharacterized protein LOC125000990 isoform X6 [Mugil cephalus]
MQSMFITALIFFLTQETVHAVTYKKPGDTVVLSPGSVGATITSITWKHNSNLAAEWYGAGATDFYRDFKGRCTLKTETGELTIPKLTLKDSGSYTPEINNRVLATTEIKIISPVPKPTISMSCDDKKTHCVLTCEGNTTGVEQVTYTWKSDGVMMKSKSKEINITKEETSSFFRCTMENPVSSQFSNQVVNPVLVSNTDIPNMYKKVGDRLDLSVSSKGATITSIVWKHGSNVVVEWNGGEPVVYGDFKGRCTLDTRTGELTISGLKPKDSGSYTAEINGDAIKTTKIKVIYEVPKPTISMSCDDEKTHCVLTCEGDTTGVEQVTYTWKSGDVVKSETKEFKITKKDTEASFVCTVKNPVSSESSEAVDNPLTTNNEFDIIIYKTVGDEVVLSPGSKVDDITSLTWKYGPDTVVDLFQGKSKFYHTFKGHYKLDTTTGELTIFNLTLEDSGIYIAEINDKVLDPTELKVFSPVPKPTVSMSCDDEKTHCVLTCEGNTTDVGPVTYTWWSDNKIIHETKELIITKEEKEPSFTCEVNNSVSSKRSEEFINPFITNKKQNSSSSTLILIFLGVVVAVVAVGTCVGVFCCKRRGGHVPVRTNEHAV